VKKDSTLGNTLSFSIEEMNLIEEMSDDQLAIAEIYICHDGMNKHEMPISLETLKLASKTLLNKFLVAGFNGKDFMGHEGQNQKIIGFFPAENDIRYIEKDGRTFLVANAIISKIYAKWAYDLFMDKDSKSKSISMEISLIETRFHMDGYKWIEKFIFNGVTVLGEDIEPAMHDSDATLFKFSKEELVENGEKFYHEHFSKSDINDEKKDSKTFSIPKEIKDNVTKGFQLKKEAKSENTSVCLANAKYLLNREEITTNKIKQIYSYFSENEIENIDPIEFLFWGGVEGKSWIENLYMSICGETEAKNDTAISSNEGLDITLDCSEENKESELVSKIEKTQDGLSFKENTREEDFSLEKLKLIETITNMETMSAYRILDIQDDILFAMSTEDREVFGIPYTVEEEVVSLDVEARKSAKLNYGYAVVECEVEEGEEEGEEKEDDKEDDKEAYMSLFSMLELKLKNVDFSYENKRTLLRQKALAKFGDWCYIDDFDEEFVYIYSDGATKRYSYDSETLEIMMDSGVAVCSQTTYVEFGLDENIEAVAQVEEEKLDDESKMETIEENTEESNISKMTDEFEELGYSIDEVKELILFKANVLKQKESEDIEFACSEVTDVMPKEEIEKWKEKFSEFENLSAWTNALKAEAFTYIKSKPEEETEKTFTRRATAVTGTKPKDSNEKWWDKH